MENYHCTGNIKEALLYLSLQKYHVKKSFTDEAGATVFIMDRPVETWLLNELQCKFKIEHKNFECKSIILTAENSQDKIVMLKANGIFEPLAYFVQRHFSLKSISLTLSMVGLLAIAWGYFHIYAYLYSYHLQSFVLPIVKNFSKGYMILTFFLVLLPPLVLLICFSGAIKLFSLAWSFIHIRPETTYWLIIVPWFSAFLLIFSSFFLKITNVLNYIVLALLITFTVFSVVISRSILDKEKRNYFIGFIIFANLLLLVFVGFSMIIFFTLASHHSFSVSEQVIIISFIGVLIFSAPIAALIFSIVTLEQKFKTARREKANAIIGGLSLIFTMVTIVTILFYYFYFHFIASAHLGSYYQKIYVTNGLERYRSIMKNLNYNKTHNQIYPWIIYQDEKYVIFSKNIHSTECYVFTKQPYLLVDEKYCNTSSLTHYFKIIKVTSSLNKYPDIIRKLNYDKKKQTIRPWVFAQGKQTVVFANSSDSKICYIFSHDFHHFKGKKSCKVFKESFLSKIMALFL